MKALILCYSCGGSIRQIVKKPQAAPGCDLAETEITASYTGSYDSVVEQGRREVQAGFDEHTLRTPAKDSDRWIARIRAEVR